MDFFYGLWLGFWLGFAVFASDAKADVLNIDTNEAVVAYVDGDINGQVSALAKFLDSKVSKNSSLWLLINSPGGDVSSGQELIRAMGRLKEVNCLVTGRAQSMAFMILAACNKRYAFPATRYMFHAAYRRYDAGDTLTVDDAAAAAIDLRATDVAFRMALQQSLKVPFDALADYYKNSTTIPLKALQKISPGWIVEVNDLHIK